MTCCLGASGIDNARQPDGRIDGHPVGEPMFRQDRHDFAKPFGTANELRNAGVVQNGILNLGRDVAVNDNEYSPQSASQHNHQPEGGSGRIS